MCHYLHVGNPSIWDGINYALLKYHCNIVSQHIDHYIAQLLLTYIQVYIASVTLK